ncbi:MAG TPA: hypothetical protein VLS52_09070, partial [Rudaea sp.]|nr:hypothetical protein [Rudaea sp.]
MPAEPLPLKRPFAKCPLCRASIERCALHQTADISRHPLYSTALPTQLRWLHCADCNHIFTQDFWTEAGEKLVFASTLPHQMPGTQSGEPLRAIWAPTVARVASLLCLTRPRESVFGTTGTSRPRWVDIGFGNGALVATADEFGFDALGIDVRPAAVEALANAGYKAAQVSFSDLVLDAPVAV